MRVLQTVIAFMLITVVGCSRDNDGTSSVPVADRLESESQDSAEWIVFLASRIPRTSGAEIQDVFGNLFSAAHEGDVITVLATPSHERIATVRIPKGNLRTRQKDTGFARAIHQIHEFLDRVAKDVGSEGELSQLDIPSMSHTVARFRQSKRRLVIIAIGNPVYCPDVQSAWSMNEGRVIADGSLLDPNCPFGSSELSRLPPDAADVFFIAPGPQWGDSPEHRRAIERFYSLYVHQLGGAFHGVFTDIRIGFNKAVEPGIAQPVPDSLRDPSYVGMWSTRRTPVRVDYEEPLTEVSVIAMPTPAPAESSANASSVDKQAVVENTATFKPLSLPTYAATASSQEVDRRLRNLAPGKIAIGLIFHHSVGPVDSDLDCDLWVRDATVPEDEINYRNMTTAWGGTLFRDVQQVMTGVDDFTRWEYLEVDHSRIEDLDVWIDAFRCSAPVKCVIRVSWNSMVRETVVNIETNSGDLAHDQAQRATSPAWKHVPLRELFTTPSQ